MTSTGPYGGIPGSDDARDQVSYAAPPPSAVGAKRPVIVWDLVLTLILVLPLILAVGSTTVFSPLLVMASDPCGSVACNTGLMTLGIALAFFGPIVIFLISAVFLVIQLIRRRLAFYIPLIGIAVIVGVFMLGVALVISGVPGATF